MCMNKEKPWGILNLFQRHWTKTCEYWTLVHGEAVCEEYMENPFVTECGHAFCSYCLREWFASKLAPHLDRLTAPSTTHAHHSPETCRTLPNTPQAAKKFRNALRSHGLRLQTLFQYPCPACCQAIQAPPALDFMSSSLFQSLWPIVRTNREDLVLAQNVPHGTQAGPFTDMFLPRDYAHLIESPLPTV
ncbi:hypothetical protein FA15DRAFT_661159 [Coprinopsis marcescibilis]|uniref:RING-type domain-containing protein n=1 Tax=Coprinopsis marcescibilis TaxID=230819 RepID=A0A5C3KDU4_COPMA|nr:hypothetical protein FA15DRAFT_661159 [Coprinopsis marcescibilis]